MKKKLSESGFFRLRVLLGLCLCLGGLSFALMSFAASSPTLAQQKRTLEPRRIAPNSNPTSGTLTPAGPNVTWMGTASGGASVDESTCNETLTPVNCDTFTLTLSGNPSDWAGKKAHIVISWSNANDDYDVFIHKGSNTGATVGSSAQSGAGPEVVDIDPSNPNVGTGVFTVHVVYFLANPTLNGQYSGSASAIAGGTPTPTPTPPGATPTPTPTPVPSGPGVPRYQTYYPPTGVADDAGEPSLGINWKSEETHTNNRASDGAVNPAIPNGGTSNYYGGFLTYMLRARFDDCSSPATVDWQEKPVTLPALPRAAGDPILFTDHETGRTFVSQLLGLTPGGSTMEYTDDDGETFNPSEGGAPSGVDHQTIGGGPFHDPVPTGVNPLYPNAVYYASQSIAEASSQLSVDGGITFPVQTPMFTAAQCAGLHGHLKVGPDGTAFVPDKACVATGSGVPLLTGGAAAVVVSEDNGVTWTQRPIPGEVTTGNDDPSVGVSICRPNDLSCDKALRSNTIYLGYQADTPTGAHPKIAVSHDKGVTWEHITDVGALPGGPVINNMAFPEVVVGDPDRAAFAFFGTPTAGTNSDQPEFPGDWYLYIATTYDGGVTWSVINASPNDPIQHLSGICGDGTCRNLLDFFDIQVDKEGRILVGGEDGCIGGCVNGGPNSFTAKAFITRQSGGQRLFANFDPVEPAIPGAPLASGALVTVATPAPPHPVAQLTWQEPDNGGAAINQYKVYKNSSFTAIATTTARNFTDLSYMTGDTYRITAVNAQGESPYCSTITPSGAPVASACVAPGILVSNDLTQAGADDDSGQNTPIDPRVNARQLFIAEPFVSSTVDNFVFTLLVAPSTTNSAPPNSQWFIIWNRQGTDTNDPQDSHYDRLFLAMATDPAGSIHFDYGKFGFPINTSVPPPPPNGTENTPVKFGTADSGSYDPLTGVITITIAKSKLRAIDGGSTKYQAGSDLAATNVRTYFNRPDYQPDTNPPVTVQRSQNNASDITADGSYSVAGSGTCAPAPQLVSAVSRKSHGMAGEFDVKLFPIVADSMIGIEPRRETSDTHHIVFVFAAPISFTGVNVSGTHGAVTTTPAAGSGPVSEITVNVAGVANAQTINIDLLGVTAGGASATISIPMGVLLGDVNASRAVDSGDVFLAQQQNGLALDESNFTEDVNTSGRIDSGDVFLVRQRNPSALP